jgi:MYXO-CTERM domain-containing protein
MKHLSRPARVPIVWTLAASLAAVLPAASAIVFVNSDLESSAALSTVPGGWEKVPFDAPFSEATQDSTANGDVIDANGPGAANGIFGAAHSGETFFGGGHTNPISGTVSHEGLEQTVGGFTVGEEYSFSFFQANVGINNARDTAGSWRVYANGELIGTTIPTSTTLEWNDANKATGLVWEERTVTFTAAAESITLSFLPYDTDGNISNPDGVYMGIDSFSEITPVPEPGAVGLGLIAAAVLLRRRRN